MVQLIPCIPKRHHLLPQLNPDLILPFRLSWKKAIKRVLLLLLLNNILMENKKCLLFYCPLLRTPVRLPVKGLHEWCTLLIVWHTTWSRCVFSVYLVSGSVCHYKLFLSRDDMLARYMPWPCVCVRLYLCLSVTTHKLQLYRNRWTDRAGIGKGAASFYLSHTLL